MVGAILATGLLVDLARNDTPVSAGAKESGPSTSVPLKSMTLNQLTALDRAAKEYAALAQQIQNGCVQAGNCSFPKEHIRREQRDAAWRRDYVVACKKYRKIDVKATRLAADEADKRRRENFSRFNRGEISSEEQKRLWETDTSLVDGLEAKYSSELKQCAEEFAKERDAFEKYRDAFFSTQSSLYYDMLRLQSEIANEISRKKAVPSRPSRPAVTSVPPAPSITLAPQSQPSKRQTNPGKAVRFASCSRFEQHVAGKVLGTGGCDIVFESGARRSMWAYFFNARRGKIVDETFYIKRSGNLLQDCEVTLWENGGFLERCRNL